METSKKIIDGAENEKSIKILELCYTKFARIEVK
jgi:hypothetical protein